MDGLQKDPAFEGVAEVMSAVELRCHVIAEGFAAESH